MKRNPIAARTHSIFIFIIAVALCAGSPSAFGQKKATIYNFENGPNGSNPVAGVTLDAGGNLWGAASSGGNPECGLGGGDCGTVYELKPPSVKGGAWTETTIYTFGTASDDASAPNSDVAFDSAGNLYGATRSAIYQLVPPAPGGSSWTSDWPYADLSSVLLAPVVDANGDLYESDPIANGNGMVFELTPGSDGTWTTTILYSFAGGKDGSGPGGLVMDKSGRIFGVTSGGGDTNCNAPTGCGTVFALTPPAHSGAPWTHTLLYRFSNVAQGYGPYYPLVRDAKGNLYGTAANSYSCPGGFQCGLIFEISPPAGKGAWTETVIHSFVGGANDGNYLLAGLTLDSKGALYGTSKLGGNGPCTSGDVFTGCGTVYRFTPPANQGGPWTETLLHSFQGGSDGQWPEGTVTVDEKSGLLYSTTSYGGSFSAGTVFEIAP
jgi:hypothetical protein